MADIYCFDFSPFHKLCIDISIWMAADMKVTRHFFNIEKTLQSTSISLLKGFFSHLYSLILILIFKDFKIHTINPLSITIKSILMNRFNIGKVRHHYILIIKRDNFTRISWKFYLDIDTELNDLLRKFLTS